MIPTVCWRTAMLFAVRILELTTRLEVVNPGSHRLSRWWPHLPPVPAYIHCSRHIIYHSWIKWMKTGNAQFYCKLFYQNISAHIILVLRPITEIFFQVIRDGNRKSNVQCLWSHCNLFLWCEFRLACCARQRSVWQSVCGCSQCRQEQNTLHFHPRIVSRWCKGMSGFFLFFLQGLPHFTFHLQ